MTKQSCYVVSVYWICCHLLLPVDLYKEVHERFMVGRREWDQNYPEAFDPRFLLSFLIIPSCLQSHLDSNNLPYQYPRKNADPRETPTAL